MHTLAFLYGFLLPFTSVLAISTWLNPTVIVALIAACFILTTKLSKPNQYDYIIFFLFVFPAILSAAININYLQEPKFLSHLLSYLFTYFMFYMVAKEIIRRNFSHCFKGMMAGLVFSIIYAFIEFYLVQEFGPDALMIVPRFEGQEYEATVASQFFRARSLASESGHYALFVGIMTPLAILYLKHTNSSRLFSYSLLILSSIAMLLTFSTSGLIFSLIAVLFGQIAAGKDVKSKGLKMLATLLAVLAIYIGLIAMFDFNISAIIFDKIDNLNGRSGPFNSSLSLHSSSDILQIIFGLGPGYYDYRRVDPVISLTALTFFQTGFFGLFSYLLMYLISFKKISSFPSSQRIYIWISLLFALLVYCGISDYWYPWLWFLLAFISTGSATFIRK